MNFKNEKQLLFVIKYSLPTIILLLSIISTSFFYFQNKADFENIKKDTKEKLIENKKQLIKEHINSIYKYILQEQKETEKNIKDDLSNRVNKTHETILNIYNRFKNTYSKQEIIEIIRTTLRNSTYNKGRGYFFVYDKQGINIVHPLLPHLEDTLQIDYKDAYGEYTIKKAINKLNIVNESFLSWYWRKDKNDLKEYKKIGYIKNIELFDWFIGTGEYIDDFKKDLQNKTLNQIRKLTIGEGSYVFVIDEQNDILSSFSKDKLDLKDEDILNNIKYLAKGGGGYVVESNKDDNSKQIAYVKLIPQWNWLIGISFNINEVQAQIDKQNEIIAKKYKKSIAEILVFSILLSSLIFILSLYISRTIQIKFKSYKKDINLQIRENEKQYELLAQKSKLAAMGEMMENIAHQWRQPLSMITISATSVLLQKELKNLNDDFLEESLENINTSANHLSDTIEDFRDFFKPDKEKSSFIVGDACDKSLKLLTSRFKNKNIKIIKNIDYIELKSYQRELLQVLLNILNNAKDALDSIDEEKLIFIDVFKKEETLFIQIKDNAGGIKSDVIERVFEPYFTTKHKSQGTGIGLYMSEEIISRHMKGELKVFNEVYSYENTEYIGALFSIEIPILE